MQTDLTGLLPPSRLSTPPRTNINLTTPKCLFSHQKSFQLQCTIGFNSAPEDTGASMDASWLRPARQIESILDAFVLQYQWSGATDSDPLEASSDTMLQKLAAKTQKKQSTRNEQNKSSSRPSNSSTNTPQNLPSASIPLETPSTMYLEDDAWNTVFLETPTEVTQSPDSQSVTKLFTLHDLEIPKNIGSPPPPHPQQSTSDDQSPTTPHITSLTLSVKIGIPKRMLQVGEFRSLPLQEHRPDFLGAPYEYTQFSRDERECVVLHHETIRIKVEHALSVRCLSTRISTDKAFIQLELENLTKDYNVQLLDLAMHLFDSRCLRSINPDETTNILTTRDQTEPSHDQISLAADVGSLYRATRMDTEHAKPLLGPREKFSLLFTIDPIHGYKAVEKQVSQLQRSHATPASTRGAPSPYTYVSGLSPSPSAANTRSPSTSSADARRSTILGIPVKLGEHLKRNLLKTPQSTKRKSSLSSHSRTLSASPSKPHPLTVPKPPKILSNFFEYESRIEVSYGVHVQERHDFAPNLNAASLMSPQSSLAETTCGACFYAKWIAVLPRGLLLRARLPDDITALQPFLVELWIFNYSGHSMDLIFTVPTESDSKFICQDTQIHLGALDTGEVKRLQLRFIPVEAGLKELNAMYLVDRHTKEEFLFPSSVLVWVGEAGGAKLDGGVAQQSLT